MMREERYDRQIRAFGTATQQRLAELTVGVIGAGGVGSLIVQSLVCLGVGRLLVVDPDVVELSNLNRLAGAIPADASLRRSKVRVAERAARRVNPDIAVQAVRGSVLDDAVWCRLRAADVLVGAVDGHAPRWAINRLAVQYARCYIDVGAELGATPVTGTLEAGGHVAVVRPAGPCLLCLSGYDPREVTAELDPGLVRAQRASGYRADAAQAPTPGVVFVNQVLAGHAVAELVNWVSPWRPPTPYVLVDLAANSSSALHAQRHAECAACGPGSVRGLSDAGGVLDAALG